MAWSADHVRLPEQHAGVPEPAPGGVEAVDGARDAKARGRTLRRHAVAWVLEQPGVTAAIIGVRNAHEGNELPTLAAD